MLGQAGQFEVGVGVGLRRGVVGPYYRTNTAELQDRGAKKRNPSPFSARHNPRMPESYGLTESPSVHLSLFLLLFPSACSSHFSQHSSHPPLFPVTLSSHTSAPPASDSSPSAVFACEFELEVDVSAIVIFPSRALQLVHIRAGKGGQM